MSVPASHELVLGPLQIQIALLRCKDQVGLAPILPGVHVRSKKLLQLAPVGLSL